jgi:hypothetical protein
VPRTLTGIAGIIEALDSDDLHRPPCSLLACIPLRPPGLDPLLPAGQCSRFDEVRLGEDEYDLFVRAERLDVRAKRSGEMQGRAASVGE